MMNPIPQSCERIPSSRVGTNPIRCCAGSGTADGSMAGRAGSSAGPKRQSGSILEAGRYEEAALPDYGIDRLHVTLDPALLHSYLKVENIGVYSRLGATRVVFDCPTSLGPDAPPKSTRVTAALEEVCDAKFDLEDPVRAYRIRTHIVLADRLVKADLWLVELAVRSTDLVLGTGTLRREFRIDIDRAFCLPRPNHSYMDAVRTDGD